MSAPGTSPARDVSAWIAERHESDVTAIMAEMRRPERLIDEVIEEAFRLSLQRGDITEAAHEDFTAWARQLLRRARSGRMPSDAGWSPALREVLQRYLDLATAKRTTAGNVAALAEAAASGVNFTASELEISQAVAGVLVGSVTMWSPGGAGARKASGEQQINAVLRSDVMGAITGAASTAITGGGAAAGASIGAVLGSAVEAVLQNNAADAVDAEEVDPGPAPNGH